VAASDFKKEFQVSKEEG